MFTTQAPVKRINSRWSCNFVITSRNLLCNSRLRVHSAASALSGNRLLPYSLFVEQLSLRILHLDLHFQCKRLVVTGGRWNSNISPQTTSRVRNLHWGLISKCPSPCGARCSGLLPSHNRASLALQPFIVSLFLRNNMFTCRSRAGV